MFTKWKWYEPRLYCRVYLLSISEMQGMLMEFSPVSTAIFWLNLLWRDICIRLLENELGEVTLTLGRVFSWLTLLAIFDSSVFKFSFLPFRDNERETGIMMGELKSLHYNLVVFVTKWICYYLFLIQLWSVEQQTLHIVLVINTSNIRTIIMPIC